MDSQNRKISQCESSDVGETSPEVACKKQKEYSSDSESSDDEETRSGSDPDAEKTSSDSKEDAVETSSGYESDAEDESSDAENEEGEKSSRPNSDRPAWDYDVFLSFRGPDVRDDFVHYLYGDLKKYNWRTFMDDNELRVGEDIGESLFKAIKHSKVFVPILSENYASSKWCLKELKCKVEDCNQEKHVILPVFYNVSPSDVKHQSGSYEEAFCQHRSNGISEDVIQTWKNVLNKVGNMKGLVLETDAKGQKCELKNLVIEEVENLLKDPSVLMTDNLVGIEDQVEEIMKLLDLQATGIRIVGLCGMGGIGKTTIAKFIYNKLLHEFQACSFLADVKESSQQTQGLVCLQKQLIDDISKQSNTNFSRIDDGIKLIREIIGDKKVIIVLDDVGDKNYVDILGGGIQWFGAGSRVIITTRDKEVVNIPMSKIYEVKGLDVDESLKLFCRHAFKRDHPPSNRKRKLATKIVATTDGLPLALEVIGSLLYNKKNLEEWRGIFDELKVSPRGEIQATLMISYRDLNDRQREMFLDIACFFIGYVRSTVFPVWNVFQLFPESNFSALVNKCLVRIDDVIRMHDQLRDFGRDLVRKGNIMQPDNWSRVWDMEDVLDVLRGNKDTCKAEAISCHNNIQINYNSSMPHVFTPKYKNLEFTNKDFANKSSLRYLQVRGAKFYGDFNGLFPSLIWLCFDNCHFPYTLTNFCPKKLVFLELESCDVTEKWNGWKFLEVAVNLKILVVNCCENLRKSPKFTKNNGLERLSLHGCENMVEIDASIKNLQHLIYLNLTYCRGLKKLPEELSSLKKLKALYIHFTGIKFLPNSIEKLSKLESFSICPELVYRRGCHWSQHQFLPMFSINGLSSSIRRTKSFGCHRNLLKLGISNCRSFRKLPKSIGELRKLRQLKISNCPLEKLPSFVTSLKSLNFLKVKRTKIRKLPNSIGNLKNLKELNVFGNQYLQGLPNSMWNLEKLETLDASWCEAMEVSIPDDIGNLINLRIMNLNETKIQSMSTSICNLSGIQELNFNGDFLLGSLQDLPTSLRTLSIRSKTLESLGDLSNLTNLTSLDVECCLRIREICGLSKLVSLTHLNASDCSGLVTLDGLEHLALLQRLIIRGCKSIEQLPVLSHLKYLRRIECYGCKNFEIQAPEKCYVDY